MKASDVMTSPAVTVSPYAKIKVAARMLTRERISGMPVVDADGAVIGLVTEADLLRLETPPPTAAVSALPERYERAPSIVAHVMTPSPITVSEDDDVAYIAELMLRRNFRRLPVVRGRRVVGIVSRRDVVRLLGADDDIIAAGVRRALDDHRDRELAYAVTVRDGVAVLKGQGDLESVRIARTLARAVPGVLDVRIDSH
jgi:CBS domain-containing protein